jgi:thiol-disulfide isomerase/thioredoxin
VYPDRVVTAERIQPPGQSPAADADELIRAFVQRYHKTPAAPQALMEGYRLAVQIRNVKVAGEFVTTLEKDHADAAGVFRFLAEIGRRPLFQAELTRLDGTRLLLPADVKGKIVVIEFWATWDPACATNQPVMRKVYARYKDKGVEIVGINLDTPGRLEELKQYVKDAGLPWTQTYSGLFRDDPAARKCSIEAVPSVWVLDREGRVISAGAGEDLSRTLDLALAEGR